MAVLGNNTLVGEKETVVGQGGMARGWEGDKAAEDIVGACHVTSSLLRPKFK